jgi:serine/threonine protein kinase
VKSANILIDSDGNVTLGDFGAAAIIKENSKKNSFVGSYSWMAPEVIAQEGYDLKVI